jgi:tetrahydromethanopterin S-methyltransferase subunit B
VQAMIKKKVHVTSRSSWKKDIITLFFDGDRINKKKAELSQIINDLNQELETWLSEWNAHPDWDYQPIQFENAQVIMKTNFTYASPLDTTINDFRDKFLVMLWNNFVSITN